MGISARIGYGRGTIFDWRGILEARMILARPARPRYEIGMRQIAPAISKSSQIRSAWATGDQIGALRIAARFFDRSL
jgi:hypothetical protein